MFVDAAALGAGHVERARICVFGSGPAGLTIAHGMAEHGYDVLLIEAGGMDYSDESQDFYRGTVIGDHYFELSEARLRMFGGTSNHWGGHCIPLAPQDFQPRSPMRDTGWPISDEDLKPYLPGACQVLEVPDGFETTHFAPRIERTSFQYSAPIRVGDKYQDYCEKSEKLRVFLDSALTGVEVEGGRVTAAQITRLDGTTWKAVADTYVTCLGGIENPRMLLWMNQQTGGALVPKAETLGRYWMEHPNADIAEVIFNDSGPDFFRNGYATFALTAEAQAKAGVLNAGLLAEEAAYHQTKALIADLMCSAPGLGRRLMSAFGKELVCGARMRCHWEQAPVAENRVALGTEKDHFGIPRPELHWRRSDFDRKVVVDSVRVFAEDLARADLGRARLMEWISNDGPIPDARIMANWHHMGGTRMSASATDGIVDTNLKLWGMDNFYVGGSSVFPASGYANPTLTIVQLALRLVEHLAGSQ